MTVAKKRKRDIDCNNVSDRQFDFSRVSLRHIALRIAYIGWNYHGLAAQSDSDDTIEGHLFAALRKTCLIPSLSISTLEQLCYSRCGRTDIGVSALENVVSLHVRSTATSMDILGVVKIAENTGKAGDSQRVELDYCSILNRVLPEDIRITGWSPVDITFNARYDCTSRSYKGCLDVSAMREAAQFFVGTHDFRNFCKMDITKVSHFTRTVTSMVIEPVYLLGSDIKDTAVSRDDSNQFQPYAVIVTGTAFLWHMVRCMMAVLFLVGQRLEAPTIVRDLLNVTLISRKPLYMMADESPLLLYSVSFGDKVRFSCDEHARITMLQSFQRQWAKLLVRGVLLGTMTSGMCLKSDNDAQEGDPTYLWQSSSKHVSLISRPMELTYDERVENMQRKNGKKIPRAHKTYN